MKTISNAKTLKGMKGFLLNSYSRLCLQLMVALSLLLQYSYVFSEGTKEFRPDSTYYGNMQINDQQRPFALESNTDPLHRLYFHINDYTTEKAYMGFGHAGSGTATYRITDPNGNVVKARASIPTSGTGYIKYYSQAVAGPKINSLPAGGYTPIVFTPSMNGDYYIEFTTSYQGTNTAYEFDLFDLTVAKSTNNRITGRLWSYAWDLSTRSSTNRYWGKLYNYTSDGYVTQLNLNGVKPYGFVAAGNNTGTNNVMQYDQYNIIEQTGDNRQSETGNSIRPQYKMFLNNPDPVCYPSGTLPSIATNVEMVDTHPQFCRQFLQST